MPGLARTLLRPWRAQEDCCGFPIHMTACLGPPRASTGYAVILGGRIGELTLGRGVAVGASTRCARPLSACGYPRKWRWSGTTAWQLGRP